MSPAVPLLGSHDRKLKKGDLVFVDIGCGYHGYHTDKTMTYMFGRPIPEPAIGIHQKCVEIQDTIAPLLKPGAIPSQIYETIIGGPRTRISQKFHGIRKPAGPVPWPRDRP